MQMLAPLGKNDHVVVLLELHIQLLDDKPLPFIQLVLSNNKKIGNR